MSPCPTYSAMSFLKTEATHSQVVQIQILRLIIAGFVNLNILVTLALRIEGFDHCHVDMISHSCLLAFFFPILITRY